MSATRLCLTSECKYTTLEGNIIALCRVPAFRLLQPEGSPPQTQKGSPFRLPSAPHWSDYCPKGARCLFVCFNPTLVRLPPLGSVRNLRNPEHTGCSPGPRVHGQRPCTLSMMSMPATTRCGTTACVWTCGCPCGCPFVHGHYGQHTRPIDHRPARCRNGTPPPHGQRHGHMDNGMDNPMSIPKSLRLNGLAGFWTSWTKYGTFL